MDRIELDLFGGLRVRAAESEISLSPLQAAALALLASYDGRGVTRARIVELLWNEEPDRATRHRLSQLLYALSCKLPVAEYSRTEGEYIALRGDRFTTDLTRFRNALRGGDLPGAWQILERGFLSDLEVPSAPYEDWLHARQLRLRSSLRERAVMAWTEAEQRGHWNDGAVAARALLSLDPCDRHLRQLLWALAMAGNVEEAAAEYSAYAERLARRGGEPEKETTELLERIDSLVPTPAKPRVVRHVEPPVVGRSVELRRLKRAVVDLPADDLRVVRVTGEGGAGKTRVVHEALSAARLNGIQIFEGSSGEFERDIPLNSLLEALAKPHIGEALLRLEEPWRTVLLALMPQFHEGPDPIPEPPYVQPGSMPRRLFEAFRVLFMEISRAGPMVIFLDDFHWADDTSVALVEYLRRRWHEGGFTLILTTRAEAFRQESQVRSFLTELAAEGRVDEVILGDLDSEAAHQLATAVAQRPLTRQEKADICALGGYNPFFIIELTLEYLAGRLMPRIDPKDTVPIPLSIQQVLERRLRDLTPNADRVLINMATYARPLPAVALEELTDLPAESCVHALEELGELRLIDWMQGNVATRHELIRQAVYAAMSEPRRAWLHRKVGAFILDHHGDPLPVDDLAFHFDRGGLREQALEYALVAAERAEASGAVPEALRCLAIARRNTGDPELEADLVWRLGHLSYLHGSFPAAIELLQDAAHRLRSQMCEDRALLAEVESIDAQRREPGDELARGLATRLDALKEQARLIGAFDAFAAAVDAKLHIYDSRGDIRAVQDEISGTEPLLSTESPRARCSLHSSLTANIFYGSNDVALKHARTAVAVAKANGFEDLLLPALNRLFLTLSFRGAGNGEEANDAILLARTLASRSGDFQSKFDLWSNEGVWHLDTGDLDRAGHCFRRAGEIIQDTAVPTDHFILNSNLGELSYKSRDYPTALHHFELAWEDVPKTSLTRAESIARAGLGLSALALGNLGLAKRHEELLPTRPSEWYFDPTPIVIFEAHMLMRRGDPRSAIDLLEETARDIRSRYVPGWLNLGVELARIHRKHPGAPVPSTVSEAIRVAQEHGLSRKVSEFKCLMD